MKLSKTLFLFISVVAVQCRDMEPIGHICEEENLASFGETCGGPITPRVQCEEGLECFYPTGIRDLPGVCLSIESVITTTFSSIEEMTELQTSTPRIVGKGEHWGGFRMNAPECASGLTCVLGTIPDVGGTCQ